MIQVLCVDVSKATDGDYNTLYGRASMSRKKRADRYMRHEDKLRCVAADGLLRYAVDKALHQSDFMVEQDSNGKPYLQGVADFHYNLSHSGQWVVIAYGATEVGVDVQSFKAVGIEGIARRSFTADEQAYVLGAAGNRQKERFFRIWTGKESYLKYLGTGMRQSLDSFSVLSELGVRLHSTELAGACLTLCTREDDWSVTVVDIKEIQ